MVSSIMDQINLFVKDEENAKKMKGTEEENGTCQEKQEPALRYGIINSPVPVCIGPAGFGIGMQIFKHEDWYCGNQFMHHSKTHCLLAALCHTHLECELLPFYIKDLIPIPVI